MDSDNGYYADFGTVGNTGRQEGRDPNTLDDLSKSPTDCFGDRRASMGGIIGRDAREISERLLRPDDLHPRLNFAKVAATSASVATPPRSMEAKAASMLRNSSCVAR
ncbi:hypothetical protein ABIF81_007699 [Bradyrhizobium daqingense]